MHAFVAAPNVGGCYETNSMLTVIGADAFDGRRHGMECGDDHRIGDPAGHLRPSPGAIAT